MSAINPASFVTPTSSLNVAPPTPTSLSIQAGQSSPVRRHPRQSHSLPYGSTTGGYGDSSEATQQSTAAPRANQRNTYFNPYQGMNPGVSAPKSQDMTGYPAAVYNQLGSADSYSSHVGHQFAMLDPNAPTFSSSHQRTPARSDHGNRVLGGQGWTGNFHNLTLDGV
jgi:hypothetical protein